jgi:hypothetical protein
MSNNKQRGRQLGPYVLGPRYKHTGEAGRIFRARHVSTGAPALVVQRTERQSEDRPLADWTVRVSSSVAPAYLAIEVDSAPVATNPVDVAEELVFMLADASRAVDTTIRRPGALQHLQAPARPPAPARAIIRRRPLLVAAVALAAGLALVASTFYPAAQMNDAELAHATDAGWGGTGELAADVVLTGLADGEPILLARPMPKKPFGNQKRPPCDVKDQLEVELFGGCWVPHERRAPCPEKLYELDGKCYLPAARPQPSPAVIFR